MMIQYILVGLLFLIAVGFLVRRLRRALLGSDKGCGGGCGSCGAARSLPSK